MKIITINLSQQYLDAIQMLQDLGFYPSRSEAIRIALKEFLKDELELYEDLDEETFKKIITNSPNKNRTKNKFIISKKREPKINATTQQEIKPQSQIKQKPKEYFREPTNNAPKEIVQYNSKPAPIYLKNINE